MKFTQYQFDLLNRLLTNKKIAIITNNYLNKSMSDDTKEEILYNLEHINPTEIIIPGSINKVENNNKTTLSLQELSEIAKVYYVSEKHQINDSNLVYENYTCFGSSNDKMNISGIRLIDSTDLNKMRILLSKYKNELEEISKDNNKNNFNILLCHEPILVDSSKTLKNYDIVFTEKNYTGEIGKITRPVLKHLDSEEVNEKHIGIVNITIKQKVKSKNCFL